MLLLLLHALPVALCVDDAVVSTRQKSIRCTCRIHTQKPLFTFPSLTSLDVGRRWSQFQLNVSAPHRVCDVSNSHNTRLVYCESTANESVDTYVTSALQRTTDTQL